MNNSLFFPDSKCKCHRIITQVSVSSSEDVQLSLAKLDWIWQTKRLIEIRERTHGVGLLFIAELASSMRLHLGVGKGGVDLCALWRGEECVIWDNLVGFCSIWPPIPTRETADDFNAQMRPLIRRNCFLLGGDVDATVQERREWIQWLSSWSTWTKNQRNQDPLMSGVESYLPLSKAGTPNNFIWRDS